jgi:hypothetical protein
MQPAATPPGAVMKEAKHAPAGHAVHSARSAHSTHRENPYLRLYLMAALSFVLMYVLMYAMVDRFANVFMNLNQVYMAGLMAAPMMLMEIVVMRAMYQDRRRNFIVIAVSLLVLVACWGLIRQQAGIGNSQFLRSMIPHHAGAILMCRELRADNADIEKLCAEIVRSQEAEIARMKQRLAEIG